jgi:predicted phage baseplate assembly protein
VRCVVTHTQGNQRPYTESPVLQGVVTQSLGGSVMASHSQAISVEIVGRSDGTPGQTFPLANPPVLPRRPGETLEVETEETNVFEPWQEVADFALSGEDDRHFTCDGATGRIELGPTIRLPDLTERRHGRVPPQGRALRFTRYRTGGGMAGNVGTNKLVQLKNSLPYVEWVTNPQAAEGGTEAESLEAAVLRAPRILQSSPRAVTARDFERLAMEASPDVARAFCLPATPGSSFSAGSINLVLVPHISTVTGVVPPEELVATRETRMAVQQYLEERRVLNVQLRLLTPTYLAVQVRVEVYAHPHTNRGALQAEAERALYRFVHPTVGGPDGGRWPFNRPLYLSDIYALLQVLPQVEHVGAVQLAQVDDSGSAVVVGDMLAVPENTLLRSATHTVTVKPLR